MDVPACASPRDSVAIPTTTAHQDAASSSSSGGAATVSTTGLETSSGVSSSEGSSSTASPCDGNGCGWTAVEAGSLHTCALDGNGAVWCWGVGAHGELGTGSSATFTDRPPRTEGCVGGNGAWRPTAGGRTARRPAGMAPGGRLLEAGPPGGPGGRGPGGRTEG